MPPAASISEDSEEPCSISYTPGWASGPDSVTSAEPGWEGVPELAKPLGAVTGDQRDVGERLGVVDERRAPADSLLEEHRRRERRDRRAAVRDG